MQRSGSSCGCRKLVRARDLRLCRATVLGVMDLRNCAIYVNNPVADALDSSLEGLQPGLSDRTVSR